MKKNNQLIYYQCLIILFIVVLQQLVFAQKDKPVFIHNPILPGFNPDPSILRVYDDYYIATSTFQWFPGVSIYHSKDLVNWQLLTNVLNRKSQLDMTGVPNSGGIFAPQISYKNGLFYLVYTNVKGSAWPHMDCLNYVVKAKEITGPWSEPVFLNSLGFDPSLFHDDDGKTYLVQNEVNFKPGITDISKIILQEFDTKSMKLTGAKKMIYDKFAEGPHIYKVLGYYHILVAMGGTGYDHMVVMGRSKSVWGPYEDNPKNPVLTSKNNPVLKFQKAGHASLVQTQTGEWYMPHLIGRPLYPEKMCPLGRETAIQKVEWTKDGWLQLEGGGNEPKDSIIAPELKLFIFEEQPEINTFDTPAFDKNFMSLREPADETWLSLKQRQGYLRMRGRLGLLNNLEQSIIARRVQSFHFEAETLVEFEPENYRQMAGLICYYDSRSFLYLRISADSIGGKSLNILKMQGNGGENLTEVLPTEISIKNWNKCYMKVEMKKQDLQFFYSKDGKVWQTIGGKFNSTALSDEINYGFTGMMVGLCVQDMAYQNKYADFDYFRYKDNSQ